jgi:uncharacterized protein (DUF2252 family)
MPVQTGVFTHPAPSASTARTNIERQNEQPLSGVIFIEHLSTGANHRSVLRAAESAEQVNHEANQENQTETTATVDRAADVEAAAAEQEQQNNDEKKWIHSGKVAPRSHDAYGA